jgi:hypothetical protein
MASRPKVSSSPDGSNSPGNYGWTLKQEFQGRIDYVSVTAVPTATPLTMSIPIYVNFSFSLRNGGFI